MSHAFLVQQPDGQLVRKTRDQVAAEDQFVFDGPNAFADLDEAERKLEAGIADAGGLDAWRAQTERRLIDR